MSRNRPAPEALASARPADAAAEAGCALLSEPAPAPGSVLVLGGTGEARRLAEGLLADGVGFVSSLAGRVRNPAMPVGTTRIGGFGGAAGLAEYLRRHGIAAVVDATHPFAAGISANAAQACAAAGVPLLRLQRPDWSSHLSASTWTWVDTHAQAAQAAGAAGTRVFLTTGRQTLGDFAAHAELARRYVLVRLVEPPTEPVPPAWEVLQSRGPFTLDAEEELLRSRRIDVLVTKDSGGPLTEPKLEAAARCGVAVVVVRRPPAPVGVRTVADVAAARAWARQQAEAVMPAPTDDHIGGAARPDLGR